MKINRQRLHSIIFEADTPAGKSQVCAVCLYDKHDDDALHCKKCGTALDLNKSQSNETGR